MPSSFSALMLLVQQLVQQWQGRLACKKIAPFPQIDIIGAMMIVGG